MLQNLAFRSDPLFHAKAQLAWNERRNAIEEKIVQLRPSLTADLNHVFKSCRGDERHPRTFSLEQSIGADRRAVKQGNLGSGAPYGHGQFLRRRP